MKKHLKPGGKLYVSFWNLWQRKFWGEHIKSLGLKLGNLPESLWWVEIPFSGTKLKRFYFSGSADYYRNLLSEAGWTNVRINFDKSKKNMWAILDLEW